MLGPASRNTPPDPCNFQSVPTGIVTPLRFVDLAIFPKNAVRPREESASELLRWRLSPSWRISGGEEPPATEIPAGLEPEEDFRVIGMGTCGTIFETPGTYTVMKKGSISESLRQDFELTNRVNTAIQKVESLLQKEFPQAKIPQCPRCEHFYAADHKSFWTDSVKKRFPADRRLEQPTFVATRIQPLPKLVREVLIELYFADDGEIQQEAKDDPDNKDCLVRLYMGEREGIRQRNTGYESLRNFELRLNMMEDLDLNIKGLAVEIAIGLAILHWRARIDGMDTEFVLGSSRWATRDETSDSANEQEKGGEGSDFQRREIHLWMLDFDKASEITFTKDAIDKQLVPAFLGNDPYFPLPSNEDDHDDDDDSGDKDLWDVFSAAYLKASKAILVDAKAGDEIMALPARFLAKVEEQVRKNAAWDGEDHVVFAE